MSSATPELLVTLIVVEDISRLVSDPGEQLSVQIYHWDQFPDDLEEYGVRIAERPKGDYEVPTFAYTDVGGPPRIVHAGNITHIDTKPIVMAVFL